MYSKQKDDQSGYTVKIPSREKIISFIKTKPYNKNQLFNLLDIKDCQKKPLSKRLNAMVRDKQLSCNKKEVYRIFSNRGLLKGTIIANHKGFGFVAIDTGGKDLRLSFKQMQEVFHGDRVKVRILNKKLDAEVVEVIEPVKNMVARIVKEDNKIYAIVDDKLIKHKIDLIENIDKYKHNQIVIIKIITHPSYKFRARGIVVQIIGDFLDKGVEIESAIYRHKIPIKFSKKTLIEARQISKKVLPIDEKGRKDITNLDLITIDGEDSRDFDDAVFAKKNQNGWKLYVAIADVSYYIAEDSALDIDAIKRGNSVYFPNRVIPMLPEEISNNICSLNPKVKRLCLVCEMNIDNLGNLLDYAFYESVMLSSARLTYDNLDEILQNKSSNLRKKYKDVINNIQSLYEVYKVLKKSSKNRGVMDFNMIENKNVFNDNGKIQNIVACKRKDSHKIIEECMLIANQAAAQFLQKNNEDFLYRVHPEPSLDKVKETKDFLSILGVDLSGGVNPGSKDFSNMLDNIKNSNQENIIKTTVLRTMKQAFYTTANQGHFGLVLKQYTHFTSPIRRYPDLLTHRAIKRCINKTTTKPSAKMQHLSNHFSITERRAEEATRDVDKWLKCEYMRDKLGRDFKGVISGVANFGIFVELIDLFVEGLVAIEDLGDDYYIYNNTSKILEGRNSGKKFNLGDVINVKLASVNLEERKINFVLSN